MSIDQFHFNEDRSSVKKITVLSQKYWKRYILDKSPKKSNPRNEKVRNSSVRENKGKGNRVTLGFFIA